MKRSRWNSMWPGAWIAGALLTACTGGSTPEEQPGALAPRFEGIGDHRRAITTRSPLAQRYFDQGLTLLYAFNQEESQRSFEQAATLDPSCAMCFWGVAAAVGPNINVPISPDRAKAGYAASQEASRLSSEVTAVERALIAAMAERYAPEPPASAEGQAALDQAYANAMREVAGSFPADDDVQTLTSDAMMLTQPWDYWTKDGQPKRYALDIRSALEQVLARSPHHPGANHYYIHIMEASLTPELALPAADRLGALVPMAGHLVHMPGHIYMRLGQYHRVSEVNQLAVAADLAYAEIVEPGPIYLMYAAHNHHFLAAGAMMEARGELALAAAREAAAKIPAEHLRHMSVMDGLAVQPALALVRFGRWSEVLAEPPPPADMAFPTALWHYARGMALAGTGQLAEAQIELAAVEAARVAAPEGMKRVLNAARDVLLIASSVLGAAIAEAQGDMATAIQRLEEAVQVEDELRYNEPSDWHYPVRHTLGAVLLAAGLPAEAEAVYREDLRRNPDNGWSLLGLSQSLRQQGKDTEAGEVEERLREAFQYADVTPQSSRY